MDASGEISQVGEFRNLLASSLTDVAQLLENRNIMSSESPPVNSAEKRKHTDAVIPDADTSAEPKSKKQKTVKQPKSDAGSQVTKGAKRRRRQKKRRRRL